MQYTAFRFKNFKGIGTMTLRLTGDVTTLIGLNESGKTTILEAIFCFSYGAEDLDVIDPAMASLREPERWIPIALRGNFNDTIEISATVRLSDDDQVAYRKYMRAECGLAVVDTPNEVTITEKHYFENSRYRKTEKLWGGVSVRGTKRQQRVVRDYPAKSPEWFKAVSYLKDRLPSIWYFPNFLFELPERFILDIPEDEDSSEERDKSSFYRGTFEQILSQLGTGATLETHVIDRVKSDEKLDQRNLKSLLLEMGRDMTSKVFDGWNRIFGRTPISQEVEIDAGRDDNTFLELKIKGPDGYYDLSERSLGFRWFFMFLLMTSYRQSDDNKDVIFLLDEPASNLHSSAQAELLKSFEKLSETCTLIYATHSHHMINIKWLDSSYVVKNDALADFELDSYLMARTAARTAISATPYRTFVAKNPSKMSYFQPVLDILDYRPSDLEPVPDVVLVEGKSDFYLLKYAIDVLGLRPSLKLIPGSGAGTLDPLIRLHIGWGKSFIVLLDGDSEGRRQRNRYERVFGVLLDKQCFILPDVVGDERVREAEDLLGAIDRTRLIGHIFSPGTPRPGGKKALRQAIVELYARREPVPLEQDTETRVTELMEKLQKALLDLNDAR